MNLLNYKFDKYTTTGNDGIIEKIFDIIQIQNGFFVEFGAWDGIKGSNCRKLFEEGWSGIFIEAEKDRYLNLSENYKQHKIDFCSIDIDGLDLEIFETFKNHMPTVVCIEGGQMLEPNFPRLSESVAKNNIQQSLEVMVESFKNRGYKVLCSYQDTFFIKEQYAHLFQTPNNLMELYLDGLYTHHRRIPWIQFILRQSGINNRIINYILQKTNYNKYGYNQRKLWAKEEKEVTLDIISSLKNKLNTQDK